MRELNCDPHPNVIKHHCISQIEKTKLNNKLLELLLPSQHGLKWYPKIKPFNSFMTTLSWYLIETSPLICGANQWTDFYMRSTSVMKKLNFICRIISIDLVTPSWPKFPSYSSPETTGVTSLFSLIYLPLLHSNICNV